MDLHGMVVFFACMITVVRFGVNGKGMLAAVITGLLLDIARIDSETLKIPNSRLMLLAAAAVLTCLLPGRPDLADKVLGMFCVSVPMFLMATFIPGSFGGGDIKLIAVSGFILGPWRTVLAAFISIVFGGFYAIYLLVSGKAKVGHHFAFGPYLVLGIWISMLFGAELVSWYISLLW